MASAARAGRAGSTGSLRIGAPAGTVAVGLPEKVSSRSPPAAAGPTRAAPMVRGAVPYSLVKRMRTRLPPPLRRTTWAQGRVGEGVERGVGRLGRDAPGPDPALGCGVLVGHGAERGAGRSHGAHTTLTPGHARGSGSGRASVTLLGAFRASRGAAVLPVPGARLQGLVVRL